MLIFSEKVSKAHTQEGSQQDCCHTYLLCSDVKRLCRLKSNNRTYIGISSLYYKYGLVAKELTRDSNTASIPRSAGSLLPICVHSKEEMTCDRLQEKSGYPVFNDQGSQLGLQSPSQEQRQ